jgi:hypothetical protein
MKKHWEEIIQAVRSILDSLRACWYEGEYSEKVGTTNSSPQDDLIGKSGPNRGLLISWGMNK